MKEERKKGSFMQKCLLYTLPLIIVQFLMLIAFVLPLDGMAFYENRAVAKEMFFIGIRFVILIAVISLVIGHIERKSQKRA